MTFLELIQTRLEALLKPNEEYREFLDEIKNKANDPWSLLSILETKFRVPDYGLPPSRLSDITGSVYAGKGTVIKSSTIEGPVYIGENCRIGPYAYIRPYTIIGDNCHIGHASEIKSSILLSNSNAPHRNFVGDSILGENVNLGNASCLANFRLDGKPVTGTLENGGLGRIIRRKMGAILEDRVKVACTVSLSPGTYVREGAWLYLAKDAVKTSYPKSHSQL